MVSRSWIAGLAVALGAWTTGCEKQSWSQVSALYEGHHHAGSGEGSHEAEAESHSGAEKAPEGKAVETHGEPSPAAKPDGKEKPASRSAFPQG